MDIDFLKQAIIVLAEQSYPEDKASDLSELTNKLSVAESAEAVATALITELGRFELVFDQTFYRGLVGLLFKAFDAAVWQQLGILINPEEIPSDGPTEYIAICTASELVCVQKVDKQVAYLGDLGLLVSEGSARVGGQSKLYACAFARVYAHQSVKVSATGYGILKLFDQAIAKVDGRVTVYAWGDSCVSVTGGQPKVEAHRQSQVEVEAGAPDLYFDECARGFVRSEGVPGSPVRVRMAGRGLVYVPTSNPERISVEAPGLDEVVFYGDKIPVLPEAMHRLMMTHFGVGGKVYRAPLERPLPIEELLAAIQPYLWELDEEAQQALTVANDEETVCEVILPYLPQLLEHGLTGDFLREHFAEETLMDHGIFMRFNFDAWKNVEYREKAFFFGNQLVLGDDYAEQVYAYEETFVITDQHNHQTFLHDHAAGYVTGTHTLQAEGEGMVIADSEAKVYAQGNLEMHLLDRSHCQAKGDALVYAYDRSTVSGFEYSRLVLCDKSQAKLDDHCRALVKGSCQVEATGKAQIHYCSFDPERKPTITVLSDKVTLEEVKDEFDLILNEAYLVTAPTPRR